MKRRELFLGMAALSVGPMLAACGERRAAMSKRRIEKVGIQLYTVRDRMATDVPGTLQRIAEIGYREVEFAGYFDHTPQEIRMMLDGVGLASPSMHTSLQAMRETPDELIEESLAVGHEYVVLGWVPPEERTSLDDYKRHIELINPFSERCRAAGLQFAYHNHDFEFEAMDGVVPMDYLLAETDPELMQVELDFYWITRAEADPFAYFVEHPGRFPLCHVKDMATDGSMADVGDGQIDFASLFAASAQAGLRHYFVERDDAADSLESAANSFAVASEIEFPAP